MINRESACKQGVGLKLIDFNVSERNLCLSGKYIRIYSCSFSESNFQLAIFEATDISILKFIHFWDSNIIFDKKWD